jgi:hypothetical protein
VSAKVAGRAVLLIPHWGDVAEEGALPGDYRKILAIVREADGLVQVRAVGERLGLDTSVRGRLEPLRAKMTKLADRGWLVEEDHILGQEEPDGDVVVDPLVPHMQRHTEGGAGGRAGALTGQGWRRGRWGMVRVRHAPPNSPTGGRG